MNLRAIACFAMTAVLAVLVSAAPAAAQARCPEGHMADGSCVKPRLAETGRTISTALSQPRISYTAPPQLPSEDRYTSAQPSVHEMLNLFTYPAVTSAVTTGTITTVRPGPGGGPITTTTTFQIRRP